MTHPCIVIQSPTLTLSKMEQIAAIAQANQLILQGAHAGLLVDVDINSIEEVKLLAKASRADFAFFPQPLANWSDIKVLAMDMDSTLINIECIDEIAAIAGRKAQVATITEAAMRGEITDFAESLRRRVAMLEGVPASALEKVYQEKLFLNPGAEYLLQKAHEAGIKTLLVSGGFTFFTERLQARLGLSETHANTLEIDEKGLLTGRVLGPIVDAQAKAHYLEALAAKEGASIQQCIAIGDGSNDLLMMEKAYYSVAYRAKPIVQDKARFSINHCGLDAVINWFMPDEH
ncbi:phosphoserine phosphatase SerB [Pelistega sp. NLN82]|uniref:Phosphoserine phosphatase n=1 Tax=Pelistega ratti TaxID=2652177 RepID=A0A6L9Y7I5_9BURK|nr:phosphoserine phosphatase SerB [Pelistega ratti]NEN76336.1 phosphoserine phosphatase SerB [Pelistega ratti]